MSVSFPVRRQEGEESAAFRASLRRALEKAGGRGMARQALEGDWRGAAARVDEALRAVGASSLLQADAIDPAERLHAVCAAAEELGAVVAPTAFLSTVCVLWLSPALTSDLVQGAVALVERAGPLPLSGDLACVLEGGRLSGAKRAVVYGGEADLALVLARDADGPCFALADLTAAGVARSPVGSIDHTRPAADITFASAAACRAGDAQSVIRRAIVIAAHEQVGAARAALEMAVDYAKVRHAFGRPIGSFQAIKHRLADVYVSVQIAEAHARDALLALASDAPRASQAAAAARVAASRALLAAAQANMQVHGGTSFTWAHDCHLYYRRAHASSVEWGGLAEWSDTLASVLIEARRRA